MRSCGRMRGIIIAVVRQEASEADRLCLEKHLTSCRSCRAERAQWLLMEHLEPPVPQRLSEDAGTRILRHLTNLPEPETVDVRVARHWVPILGGGALAVAATAVLLAVLPARAPRADHPAAGGHANLAQQSFAATRRPTSVRAEVAGRIDAGRAHIAYAAGAEFRVLPGDREIELLDGEMDIEVTPGGPGRFRVLTPRFTVQVIGTRFIVSLSHVETIHGVVRVSEPDAAGGRELALVSAGQIWHCPNPPARSSPGSLAVLAPGQIPAAQAPSALPPSAGVLAESVKGEASSAGGTGQAGPRLQPKWPDESRPDSDAELPTDAHIVGRVFVSKRAEMARLPSRSVDRLLSDARAALAAGNTRRARECVASVLHTRTKARQRAIAELLSADAMLVESRYDAALTAYRRTMDHFAELPEGETASFAVAQLLSERGLQDQAQQALRSYLARYPTGRFAEEVEKKLATIAANASGSASD